MRLRWQAAILFVALAACGSSSAAGPATSSSTCAPPGARILAANREAAVYERGGAVYGCATSADRSYRLGAASRSIREGRVGPIALAGHDVAYGFSTFGVDTGAARVLVRRLDSGQQLREASATSGPSAPESFQSVGSIVVKADGAVAWIGEASSIIRHGKTVQVHRADRRGETELESGTAIEPGSLRRRGSQLTWRDGGMTRSAGLL